MLDIGTQAPTFSLTDQNGQTMSSGGLRGLWLISWWYPQANSSGCSIQAGSFVPLMEQFAAERAAVVGISFNNVQDNDAFACEKELPYSLLSDPDRAVGAAYGVLRQPDERLADRPRRITYIVDPEGRLAFAELVDGKAVHGYALRILEVLRGVKARHMNA